MKSIHWVTTSIFKGQEGREEEEEGRRRGQRESYSTGGGGMGIFFLLNAAQMTLKQHCLMEKQYKLKI